MYTLGDFVVVVVLVVPKTVSFAVVVLVWVLKVFVLVVLCFVVIIVLVVNFILEVESIYEY